MSRVYAKVSIEMWGDKKFCELSPLPPSGQSLWIYLLTGRFRTSIPGLNLNVGIGALSDRLRWHVSQVERHWAEIETLGMASADWHHGVVWLPKGIEHNEPESPNVIKGWGKLVLPQCALVDEAVLTLEIYISGRLSAPYTKAFQKVFRDPSRNQEQEQEQEIPPNPPQAGGARVVRKDRDQAEQILRAHQGYCQHEPACPNAAACKETIARDLAQKRLAS